MEMGFSEPQMNPAELFNDFHRRMGLRNRISNALMAIALFEVNSKSPNLSKYVTDGLSIAEQCVATLEEIERDYSNYQYRSYTAKVLFDILTNRLPQDPDKTKLERYKKGFSVAKAVFERIKQKGKLDQEMVREAEQVIEEVDREIESKYASEERLYRGSFIPRAT